MMMNVTIGYHYWLVLIAVLDVDWLGYWLGIIHDWLFLRVIDRPCTLIMQRVWHVAINNLPVWLARIRIRYGTRRIHGIGNAGHSKFATPYRVATLQKAMLVLAPSSS